MTTVFLVGQPNVGKSLLMNRLTGIGAFVSNYPGTTVEITTGTLISHENVRIVDTPGAYSLRSGSAEQRVTQQMLLSKKPDIIINVVDATNLARNLYLTLELLDFGVPLVLALNQYDRLARLGSSISAARLAGLLGVEVIPVSALTRHGIESITRLILNPPVPPEPVDLGDAEPLISRVERLLQQAGVPYPRVNAASLIETHTPASDAVPESLLAAISPGLKTGASPPTLIARREIAVKIAGQCITRLGGGRVRSHRIDRSPAALLSMLFLVLFMAFEAVSYAVALSERATYAVFRPVEGWLTGLLQKVIGEGRLPSLLAAATSEGLMVPFGTVMPAMVVVYALLAVLEDTGLLSRFSAALNPVTTLMGLPGQGAIPLALGLGCRNPAVLATRLLPATRERFIAIVLLDIVVPCAATMGVVSSVVGHFGASPPVVAGSVAFAFCFLGRLLHALLPGERSPLAIEIPPLRLPVLSNVVSKTWSRMRGFFEHVLPLLVGLNIGIRLLIEGGLLRVTTLTTGPAQRLLGVRTEVLVAVLTTALQRYLAPVVLMNLNLTPREATIASVMVCLSFPCLPCTVLTVREIGGRAAAVILCLGAVLPLGAAMLLNLLI